MKTKVDLQSMNTAILPFSRSDVIKIVYALLRDKSKIMAIKFVHMVTGWNLTDSKEFVENISY